jgi:hypothetical protein
MRGADIGAGESLPDPESVARHSSSRSQTVTLQCVVTAREQATAVTMETKPPAPRALAALNLPTPVLPDKPLPVTPKVRRAILLFVNGDCKQITEAAEKVGLARESLSKALDRPHVIAYLQQRNLKRLEILAARAGAVKGELLDSDNEMVRDRASCSSWTLPASSPTPPQASLSTSRYELAT